MGNGQADLQRTASGHIVVPIGRCSKDLTETSVFLVNQEDSKSFTSLLYTHV